MSRLTRGFVPVLILGAVVILAVAMRSALISPLQLALAVAIVIVGIFPAVWYEIRRPPFRFPLLPIAGLYYAICYGLPFLMLDLIWPDGFPELSGIAAVMLPVRSGIGSPEALAVALAAIGAFVLSFMMLRNSLENRIGGFNFGAPVTPGPFRVLAYAMLAGYLAYEFIPAVRTLPSVGQLLDRIGYVVFAVFFVAGQMRIIKRAEVWVVFGLVLPLVVAHRLAFSLMTSAMLFGLLLFVLCWPVFKKRAVIILGGCAVCLVLFYFPAQEFRAQVGLPQFATSAANDSLVRKIAFFGRISVAVWARDPQIEYENQTYTLTGSGSLTMVGRRVFQAPLFNHVFKQTPANVPYWGGETYRNFLTNLVPRAIWPEKPEERFGRDFGLRYGLIEPNSHSSVNIPWIVELLANFGAVGVVAGMAFFGVLFAAVDRFFNSESVPPIERAVGLGLIFRWAYPESNFTVMCGDLLPLTIALYLYFRFGLKWLTPLFPKRPALSP